MGIRKGKLPLVIFTLISKKAQSAWNESDGKITGFFEGFCVKYFVVIRKQHELIRVNS